jgi:hypothetical protein
VVIESIASPRQLLISEANTRRDPLDDFVSERLFEAGLWSSSGPSDGLTTVRVMEDGPDNVRIAGRIWEIEHQTLHSFWLDVARDREHSDQFDWTIYLELDPSKLTPRQVRDTIDVIEDPCRVPWRAVLSGRAIAREGRLVAMDSA